MEKKANNISLKILINQVLLLLIKEMEKSLVYLMIVLLNLKK